MISGNYELTVAGKPLALEPGMVVVNSGRSASFGTRHHGAYVLDVFAPVREDYR